MTNSGRQQLHGGLQIRVNQPSRHDQSIKFTNYDATRKHVFANKNISSLKKTYFTDSTNCYKGKDA